MLWVLCRKAQIVFNATNAQHYRWGSALKLLQDRRKVSCPSRIGIGVNGLEYLLLTILCGASSNVLGKAPAVEWIMATWLAEGRVCRTKSITL